MLMEDVRNVALKKAQPRFPAKVYCKWRIEGQDVCPALHYCYHPSSTQTDNKMQASRARAFGNEQASRRGSQHWEK